MINSNKFSIDRIREVIKKDSPKLEVNIELSDLSGINTYPGIGGHSPRYWFNNEENYKPENADITTSQINIDENIDEVSESFDHSLEETASLENIDSGVTVSITITGSIHKTLHQER